MKIFPNRFYWRTCKNGKKRKNMRHSKETCQKKKKKKLNDFDKIQKNISDSVQMQTLKKMRASIQ